MRRYASERAEAMTAPLTAEEIETHYRGLSPDERSQAWVLFCGMSLLAGKMDAVAWSLHPHIRMRDLSDARQQVIGEHVGRMLDEAARRGYDETGRSITYLAALEHFGVDCPHVSKMESRYYENPRCVSECRHCGTVEFVHDPQKNERMLMIARSLAYVGREPVRIDWTGDAACRPSL